MILFFKTDNKDNPKITHCILYKYVQLPIISLWVILWMHCNKLRHFQGLLQPETVPIYWRFVPGTAVLGNVSGKHFVLYVRMFERERKREIHCYYEVSVSACVCVFLRGTQSTVSVDVMAPGFLIDTPNKGEQVQRGADFTTTLCVCEKMFTLSSFKFHLHLHILLLQSRHTVFM